MKHLFAKLFRRVNESSLSGPSEINVEPVAGDAQQTLMSVNTVAEVSCALCRQYGWLRKITLPRIDKSTNNRTKYDVLAASADQGCDACRLLHTVLQPYTLESVGPAGIEFNPSVWHHSAFGVLQWRPEYDHRNDRQRSWGHPTSVYIFTTEGSSCPWTGITIDVLEYGIASMELAVSRISKWLGDCKKAHEEVCQDTRRLNFLQRPTRLIKIRGPRCVCLDIGERDDDTKGVKYACLSHCWGGVKPIETTTHTLDKFRLQIPWDWLPRTFQDAIELACRLDFEYLWIDSLCIIQDDEEDWRRESSNMAAIYASSDLTIAASRARNGHEGLFGVPPPSKKVQAYTFANGPKPFTVYVRPTYHHAEFESAELPLLRRAWAFQERLLSRRVVHFAEEELYWECMAGSRCECMRGSIRSLNKRVFIDGAHDRTWKGFQMDDIHLERFRHERWHNIVTTYSSRQLSLAKDIFPAIQGIARLFHSESGVNYHAGLWEDNLLRDLLWFNSAGTTKKSPYRAPSWSWASNYYPDEAKSSYLDEPSQEIRWSKTENAAEKAVIIDVYTTPKGDDPFGEIVSGVLKIRGRCLRAVEEWILNDVTDYNIDEKKQYEFERSLSIKRSDKERSEICHITQPYHWHYDCDGDYPFYTEVLLMEIVADSAMDWKNSTTSIAFSRDPSGRPDIFERIGLAHLPNPMLKNAFEEVGEELTLTVI